MFDWLRKTANLSQKELLRTFNCGIGMVLAVEKGSDVDFVLSSLQGAGGGTGDGAHCSARPIVLGELVSRTDKNEPQVKIIGSI